MCAQQKLFSWSLPLATNWCTQVHNKINEIKEIYGGMKKY